LNILVIVIDTLRADHLGCYGYGRPTSPHMDAFAAQSVVFDRMIAPAVPTHPAFVTLCTGQFSITHGIVAHGGTDPVPRSAPWLPALMQDAGYTTCAVDNLANWRYGFGRGYEFYVDPSSRRKLSTLCDNRAINRRAIPWLEAHKDEPFFMMVHYWDPHTPYLPPRAYRRLFYKGDPGDPENHLLDDMADRPLGKMWLETWFNKLGDRITDPEYIIALYNGEVRYCDEGVGQLLQQVDRLGLSEDTLVVLTSDHGELFYRHGIFFDHHGLYDGVVRVPFMVRVPKTEPRRIPHLAAHVDLVPTLLDICGIEVPDCIEGTSLTPLIQGKSDEPVRPFVVSQECSWQMKWAIRTDRHKFILARQPDFYGTPMRELYDLTQDTDELHNIARENPDIAAQLEHDLESWIADKMRQNNLTEDPLITHGLTLGKVWKEQQETG